MMCAIVSFFEKQKQTSFSDTCMYTTPAVFKWSVSTQHP